MFSSAAPARPAKGDENESRLLVFAAPANRLLVDGAGRRAGRLAGTPARGGAREPPGLRGRRGRGGGTAMQTHAVELIVTLLTIVFG
ncbi:hypothetical protein AMETH_2209 [Amycolatopsis methanolica 239]|uniref:Uncharacterized protein n=1 Tax=Amycolatopsis methanolica 239 TaxID=1068978 RepID=A0A076MTQ6_AMYME|nr:hypothetical protein AMETH_2209 [Amycolatopsis methanolica 239]